MRLMWCCPLQAGWPSQWERARLVEHWADARLSVSLFLSLSRSHSVGGVSDGIHTRGSGGALPPAISLASCCQ